VGSHLDLTQLTSFAQHSHNVGRAVVNGRTAQKEDADPQVEQGAHGPNGQAVERLPGLAHIGRKIARLLGR